MTGGLWRKELYELSLEYLKKEGSVFIFTLPTTKVHKPKTFTVESAYAETIARYLSLRPQNVSRQNFHLKCVNGTRCINQVIGLNKIGSMPKELAKWLGLPNSNEYTEHSFRRTSTTLLFNAGASMRTLMNHGRWTSPKVAEGCIADPINNKRKIYRQVTNMIDRNPAVENPPKKQQLEVNINNTAQSHANGVNSAPRVIMVK